MKKGRDKQTVRAPPYTPSLSPKVRVRSGPAPVTRPQEYDNRSRESFHEEQFEKEINASQVSLPTVSEEEEELAAPAPGIARVPEPEMIPAEPRPVPNKRSSSSLGFRVVARPESAAGVSRSRPDSRASGISSTNTAFSMTSAVRRTSGLGRVTPIKNDGKPSFKDILDAQSEIRPADFRARVQASGARDYGEDVAERNMGENGFDLSSEHVRAFYQARSGASFKDKRSELFAVGEAAEEHAGQGSLSNGSYGLASRRRSLRSLQEIQNGGRLGARSPRYIRGRGPNRSQSVGSFVPPSFGERSVSPVSRAEMTGPLSPGALAADLEKLDFGFPSTHKMSATVLPEVPEAAPAPTIPTARARRDLADEEDGADDFAGDQDDDAQHIHQHHHRPLSSLAARKHSLGTIRTCSASPSSPHRPRTASTTHSSLDRSAGDCHHHHHLPTIAARRAASRTADDTPRTPTTCSGCCTNQTTNSSDAFPPPIRTRTTRGWSASSGSPTAPTVVSSITAASGSTAHSMMTTTTSASSIISSRSNNANCSASLHTANTSVDLKDVAVPDTVKNDDDTYNNNNNSKDNENDNDDADSFNIDDYLSTDAESLSGGAAPRRPTAVGEEELLLNDAWLVGGHEHPGCDAGESCCGGCGGGRLAVAAGRRKGIQLPGLTDVLPLPSPSPGTSPVGYSSPLVGGGNAGGRVLSLVGLGGSEVHEQEAGSGGCCCCCGHHRHHHRHHHHHEEEYVIGSETDVATAPVVAKKTKKPSTRSAGREREQTIRRRQTADLPNSDAAAAAEDAGYEADYVDDEELATTAQVNNDNKATKDNHDGEDNNNEDEDDRVATAVRMRKRIKKARRLAGQPTPAMMRRRAGAAGAASASASAVPVVRVDAA
ncbi:hypothetical protein VTJ04DRAFT_4597 [Mycothermus thermophilus]|uniref:uncharacterized protein n=1 Tax=Humicola insolens TaxID=85995 RepID=UPI00374441F7